MFENEKIMDNSFPFETSLDPEFLGLFARWDKKEN